MALARVLVILLLCLGAPPLLFFPCASEAGEVGVSYGRVADNLPDPETVVDLLQRTGITMVRLYDANPDVLAALANTGIKVIVMLPNEEVASAAANQSFALEWARCNVSDHYPATLIHGVAVGNEVFQQSPDLTPQLVQAMTNVQAALATLGLDGDVKVSSPIAFTALQSTFPPSSARFRDDIAEQVMRPMLQFLRRTGSYLSVNPYPFFAYADDPEDIPLEYALGDYEPGKRDDATGLVYHSLLDAMMDATYYAIENLMGDNDPNNVRRTAGTMTDSNKKNAGPHKDDVQWTESGWPSQGQVKRGNSAPTSGDDNDDDGNLLPSAEAGGDLATVANAQAYTNYLINRGRSGNTGTPHRPDADMDIYIFALFNENMKGQGSDDVERYFGLFCPPEMTKVYDFDFRGGASGGDSPVAYQP